MYNKFQNTSENVFINALFLRLRWHFNLLRSLFIAALYWKMMTLFKVVIVLLAQWSLESKQMFFLKSSRLLIFTYQRKVLTMHNFSLIKKHGSSIAHVNPPHNFCFLILLQSQLLFHRLFSDAAFEKRDLVQVAKWHSSDHVGQVLVQ